MDPLIKIKNAVLELDSKPLLQINRFELTANQHISIKGPSGSGKSSFLHSLAGFFPLSGEEIRMFGMELSPANIYAIRKEYGFLSQRPFLGHKTVAEAIRLPFQFRSHKHKEFPTDEMERLLEKLSLPKKILGQKCSSCSGGEMQRLCLVRLFLLKPKILILDEPTTGLDAETKNTLHQLFHEVSNFIAVSHDSDWFKEFGVQYHISKGELQKTESVVS